MTIYKWRRTAAWATTRAPYKQLNDLCVYVLGYDNPKRWVFNLCLNSVMVVNEHMLRGSAFHAIRSKHENVRLLNSSLLCGMNRSPRKLCTMVAWCYGWDWEPYDILQIIITAQMLYIGELGSEQEQNMHNCLWKHLETNVNASTSSATANNRRRKPRQSATTLV